MHTRRPQTQKRPGVLWFALSVACLALPATLITACTSYPFLPPFGAFVAGSSSAGVFGATTPFTEEILQYSTFVNGKAATTLTYDVRDMGRTPLGVDFNGDGRVDPVVGYAQQTLPSGSVLQILLSREDTTEVDFLSLTLDGNNSWGSVSDVAVGDLDGDGALDIVAALSRDNGGNAGVLYLHNPGNGREKYLREWGSTNPEVEFLDGSTDTNFSNDDVEALVNDILPPGATIADYEILVETGYTALELADFDRDGNMDVVASRRLKITAVPKNPDSLLPPILLLTGNLQLFLNPGARPVDGLGWSSSPIGVHERFNEEDRQTASDLIAVDIDLDGDLDLISAARSDDNAQIAWFENPGRVDIAVFESWTQHRIGSIRDAYGIDIGDVTGDGWPDVIATGFAQRQIVLFEHPGTTTGTPIDGDYGWLDYPIVTFESFQPLDLALLDVDSDETLELVVGGTNGALRYFEAPEDPTTTWTPNAILDFDALGEVGWIGFGDFDADSDLDLIVTLDDSDADDDVQDRVSWIRNQLR